MCFSLEPDLVAGTVLLPVAAFSLREVRRARELPFALLPSFLAAHQLLEALVWASPRTSSSRPSCGPASRVTSPPGCSRPRRWPNLVFAFPVLPVLVPLAVLLLEPRGARRRVVPFVALGAAVATWLATAVLTGPIEVVARSHALTYVAGIDQATLWTVLYVVAVIGPAVLSGYRSVVAFGLVNLVGLSAVAVVYAGAFASLWCVWAALSSTLVAMPMFRRRHLPDAERLRGHLRVREATAG